MKEVAFFVQHMLCGGVENALIELSKELSKAGNKVTIYVIAENGDFLSRIPDGVVLKKVPIPKKLEEILPVGGSKLSIRKNIKEYHYIRAAVILKNYFWGETEFSELNIDFNKILNLEKEYDIAVNFHIHSPFLVRYLAEKVTAKKKFTWIHNDFTTTKYNINALKGYLDCCEAYFGVSQQLVDEFTVIFPSYKEKTSVAINLVPIDEILEKAKEFYPKEYLDVPGNCLKLLSVGRLESQKGYDLSIAVCKKLIDAGCKLQWFILGEGSERRAIEAEIEKQGLEKIMHPIGIRMNPYPYFKSCDIYVQSSRHEGWGITITEAKLFSLPIVATNFAGAKEQLVDEVSGDIAELTVNSIYEKIMRLTKEPERRKNYASVLKSEENRIDVSYVKMFEE